MRKQKILKPKGKRPETVSEFQALFQKIYPKHPVGLLKAAVHLAEEAGEVSEALHNFMGRHAGDDFLEIEKESADYASCFFTTASAARIEIGPLLSGLTVKGCKACGKEQCACTFDYIIGYKAR